MEQRRYTKDLLDALATQAKTVNEQGLDILVKPIPDGARPGLADPRFYKEMAPLFTGVKGFIAKQMMKSFSNPKSPEKMAENMRRMFDGIKSIPITGGVSTARQTVSANGVEVPIRIYTPENQAANKQPVFYYIHGGGFAAGSMDVVEEMCKLVVEKTGCVSVSVGYRLAPEHPFPGGLDDCWAVLRWIYENAGSFGGDGARICISGDSAGGNLAAVCAMKDRDAGTRMVKVQALLYPTVNMAGVEDEDYHFSADIFEIAPEHAALLVPMTSMLKSASGEGGLASLLGVKDMKDPYVSPYLGHMDGLPPCIILYGEYDFLRVECESYARKLQKAGVEVKAVRYRGLSHGFADVIGKYPQAEDCMDEVGKFMMAHLGA